MNKELEVMLDMLSAEWANDLAEANKKVALLANENMFLRKKLKEYEGEESEKE